MQQLITLRTEDIMRWGNGPLRILAVLMTVPDHVWTASASDLAAQCQLKDRQLLRALDELEEAGLVLREMPGNVKSKWRVRLLLAKAAGGRTLQKHREENRAPLPKNWYPSDRLLERVDAECRNVSPLSMPDHIREFLDEVEGTEHHDWDERFLSHMKAADRREPRRSPSGRETPRHREAQASIARRREQDLGTLGGSTENLDAVRSMPRSRPRDRGKRAKRG